MEKYTQLQHKLGDRDLSDDDSDISNNDDIVPEKPEISEPEEPDLILIEDGEPVAKQGLGLVSRSGRAPLLMESSQLEIGEYQWPSYKLPEIVRFCLRQACYKNPKNFDTQ